VLVIRHASAKRIKPDGTQGGSRPDEEDLPELPTLPDLPETEDANEPAEATEPADTSDLEERLKDLISPNGGDGNEVTPSALSLSENGGDAAKLEEGITKTRSRWITADGKPIRVEQADPADVVRPGGEQAMKDPYGWAGADMGDSEIIALNRKKLEQGDPMMNIVLRDNDVVQVPTLEVGEFYVMGEISRPGVYSLTGREVTVKMAVAAAGGFGPLSWPENTILIRRVADNSEQIVPLDLQAIFQGERPDIMLKPNDVIAIGSDVRAPFYAVIRNAFRMTYGFGVIYDRNVAFPLRSTTSRRFTRW
jgi:protein involved in polysaccharide export with SLBB domain